MELAIPGRKNSRKTNSGDEVTNPKRNVGRSIVLSLAICLVVYLVVSLAVYFSLPIDRIIAAKDYALAEAARPVMGQAGVGFTVVIAIIATVIAVIGIAMIVLLERYFLKIRRGDSGVVSHSH